MRIQIELNAKATDLWNKINERPEFGASTKAGIVYSLMHSYLNPPTHYTHAAHHEKPEAAKKLTAKEQKVIDEQAEEAAKIEAGIERARAGEIDWPIMSTFTDTFEFPPAYGLSSDPSDTVCLKWTPPDDYPEYLKLDWPTKRKSQKDFADRMSGISSPKPELYHEADTPQGKAERARLAEWERANNAPTVKAPTPYTNFDED